MKTKGLLSKIFTAVAVVALTASAALGINGSADAKAEGEVKKLSLKSSAAGVTAVQANTALTLGEKRYADTIIDFEKMPGDAVIDLAYAADRMRVESEVEAGFAESLTLYADPAWLRGTLNSSTAKSLTSGWGNKGDAGAVTGLQWINGNAALGASNASSGAYRVRYRVYGDGTMVCYFANAGADNYFAGAVAGYVHNGAAWVADDGITVADKIFPTIRLRNCPEATITYYETAVYDYENACNGADFLDGTLVENTKYVETFDESTSELRIIAGTAKTVTSTSEYKTIEDHSVTGGVIDGAAVNGANLVPDVSGQIVSVYGEKITLASGQYAEATFDLSGVAGAWMETKFIADKPTDGATFGYEQGDGMLLLNDGRGKLYSQRATTWYDGWGGQHDNNYCWLNYANGNGLLGVSAGSDSLRYRVRIYDDGSAIYYLATKGQDNWFGYAYVGWKISGTAWVKEGNGLTVVNSGYFALGFRNTAAPKLTAFTAGVYNYDASAGEAAGTLVGTLYTENFGEGSKLQTVVGEAKVYDFSNALSASADADKITYVQADKKILIDNATDAGYVYSRYAIPVTGKTLLSTFTLEIPELTGAAKAVVYLGSDGSDITNAAKLTFSLNADGKIVVSDGTNSAVTNLKTGEKFTLSLLGDTENNVLINDAEVEGLSVGSVSGKNFAIGLNGVSEGNTAKIAYYGLVCKGYAETVSESDFAPAIKPYPVKLAVPVVSIDENGVATWNAIENARGYKYVIGNGEAVETTQTSVTLSRNQTIKVMAVGDGEDYLDGDYSAETTYTIVPAKLATPVVTIDENGVATWDAVENASGYKYVIDNGEAVETTQTSVTLTDGQTVKVMAVGDGEDFADGDYSEAKKYVKASDSGDGGNSGDSASDSNSGSSSGDNGSSGNEKSCFGSIEYTFGLTFITLAFGLSVFVFKKKRG